MSLSSELIKESKQAFYFNDSNNDGKITTTEFIRAFENLGILFSLQEIEEFKQIHDKDGKKLFDFKEYSEIFMLKASEYYSEEYYLEAFRVFDPDKTGLIDVQVLRRALQTLGIRMSKEEVDNLLQEGNINSDERLDYIAYIKKLIV